MAADFEAGGASSHDASVEHTGFCDVMSLAASGDHTLAFLRRVSLHLQMNIDVGSHDLPA